MQTVNRSSRQILLLESRSSRQLVLYKTPGTEKLVTVKRSMQTRLEPRTEEAADKFRTIYEQKEQTSLQPVFLRQQHKIRVTEPEAAKLAASKQQQ